MADSERFLFKVCQLVVLSCCVSSAGKNVYPLLTPHRALANVSLVRTSFVVCGWPVVSVDALLLCLAQSRKGARVLSLFAVLAASPFGRWRPSAWLLVAAVARSSRMVRCIIERDERIAVRLAS